jgi:amino acid adenylation domain-containing protein
MSYGALNRRSNQVARWLRRRGVQRETLVAVLMEPCLEVMVVLLGILKAGGAYAPVEMGVPPERLRRVLEEIGGPVVLATERGKKEAMAAGIEPTVVQLGEIASELDEESGENLEEKSLARQMAYLNFTSGSTGQPKGVVVEQRGVVRLVRGCDYMEFKPEDVVLQGSSYAWDAATFEIWGALLNGCRLVVAPAGGMLEFEQLAGLLQREQVTVAFLTTALFNELMDLKPEALGGLRVLISGGEAASLPHFRKALRELPHATLINEYGPTENTSFSTWEPVKGPGEELKEVTIGRPIANSTAFVLDEEMQALPGGIEGELYVGGDGLARGYLKAAHLTAERFVPHPFRSGERLYRTGDRARWSEDGRLEFCGRQDFQVKIRGHRVELGEIESWLRSCPGVVDAAVVQHAAASGEKSLVAYVIKDKGSLKIDSESLTAGAHQYLPDYMAPAHYVFLDRLPLTTTSKVDRQELRRRSTPSTVSVEDYQTPNPGVEERIASVWQTVIGSHRIGRHDNYFALGGDSIMSIRIATRLVQQGLAVTVRDLFEAQTVAALAALARSRRPDDGLAQISTRRPTLELEENEFTEILGPLQSG